MTDPVPSKELLYGATTKVEEIKATLLDMRAFGLRGDLPSDEALYLIGEIESARRTAEYWKAEHLAGNAEIERLQRQQTNLIAALGEAQAKIDELSIHAAKWVKRATTPAHEREMPHCSTCACPPYDAKALDEARRFKVGDEVPIAHWGETSKIVSIHCTLANGETIAVDCIAPEPAVNPFDQAKAVFAGKKGDGFLLKMWFDTQEDLDKAFDVVEGPSYKPAAAT